MVPLLLKNWRINGKERREKSDSIRKKGRRRTIKKIRATFSQDGRGKILNENHWNAIRATGLRATRRFGRPTDSTHTRSSLLLPPRRYLSRSLPFFLSLQRLRPSATGLSVPFQHADLPSARYEARVSSSEFNRRGDHTAIQWIPFPRCPSGWSNALNYSLALPHVLHNRREILIDPFFLVLEKLSYQCIHVYI